MEARSHITRRRRTRSTLVALSALTAFVAVAGCSLFVDTSDLEDSAAGVGDATTGDESSQNLDANSDHAESATPLDDGGDAANDSGLLNGIVLLLHMTKRAGLARQRSTILRVSQITARQSTALRRRRAGSSAAPPS